MAIFNDIDDVNIGGSDGGDDGRDLQDQDTERVSRRGSSEHNGRSSPAAIFNPYYTGRPRTPATASKHSSIDRQEIIRKIKSRESRPTSPELERRLSSGGRKHRSPTPQSVAGQQEGERQQSPHQQHPQETESLGQQIERPRSALHRGDFRGKEDSSFAFERFGEPAATDDAASSLSTSPVAPWHSQFPAAAFKQVQHARPTPFFPPGLPIHRPARTRAVSNAALSNNFVYHPPTSPLVQSSRPDTPEPPARSRSRSPDKSRRHTFSPASLRHSSSGFMYPMSARHPPSLRAERTFPYQAHQPRRSLNSFASLPQSPALRARRPSLSESPLQHAPMVGSYEESILRGRMSTTPSKPLNFVAQIGVLGKGNCKSTLRCPPHVTVPFPAVFYSYGSSGRTTNDQPSPYVGLVDLENSLPAAEPSSEKRRQRLHARLSDEGSRASSRTRDPDSAPDAQAKRRLQQKRKRRSGSPTAPPGGSYRIPRQGQLQIIIKNPNKTAVKLFLVPYDLSDMEPGQKTFIRQRSYSAGPIIDMPLSSRKNFGTDRPEAALSTGEDPNERPMLRYLVHLHLCCPSKGRYFLYKSIRVVFANRVPDGKEKLCNEIQLPEPRYSAYKPGRDSNVGLDSTSRDTSRRRSAFESTRTMTPPPPLEDETWPRVHSFLAQSLPSTEIGPDYGNVPMPALPYHVNPLLSPLESRPASREMSGDGMDVDSQGTQSSRSARSSPITTHGETQTLGSETKLDDPFHFDRDQSRERMVGGVSESLLSRRLRDLAVLEDGGVEEYELG